MKTKFFFISILFCARLSLAQMPAGTIVAFGGDVTNIPSGWLLCDGTVVSSTQYPQLSLAIGITWGYGTGAPGSFNLPDMRGVFLRGVDFAAGKDLDKDNRTFVNPGGHTGNNVGSYQADEIGSHRHPAGGGGPDKKVIGSTWDGTGSSATGYTGGNETRPKNVYVVYIIKT